MLAPGATVRTMYRHFFAVLLVLLLGEGVCSKDIIVNQPPRQLVKTGENQVVFRGDASERNHFKLLEIDGDSLLVGARNRVYNLSAESLEVKQTLEWTPTEAETSMCRRKGKSQEDCHNYIRVLVKQPKTGWTLVCGTNAYKPTCRQYDYVKNFGYRSVREFDGYAISPYDPADNSTTVYLSGGDDADDVVYSATVSDFSGEDSLIYRKRLSLAQPTTDLGELRTKRNDVNFLNDPNFVGAFESGNHVYFWFRETAVEDIGGDEAASGTAVYGRVARVCKDDRGGSGSYDGVWTTFTKARLGCTLNENKHNLHFNELQAISDPTGGVSERDERVYAVFGTPSGVVQMSAVCVFRMRDVRAVFDRGAFKYQRQPDTIWSAFPEPLVPTGVRPGTCVSNSKNLPKETVNFIRRHPLMDATVQNALDKPLLIDTRFGRRLTQIAVERGVRAVNGRHYDLLYVGTDTGVVLKLLNNGAVEGKSLPVVIEQVNTGGKLAGAVRNLLLYKRTLIVVSAEEVHQVAVEHCRWQNSCTGCVRLQDPHCAWNPDSRRCETSNEGSWPPTAIQNLLTGKSSLCPQGEGGFTINEEYAAEESLGIEQPDIGDGGAVTKTSSKLPIAIIATLVVGTFIGFAIGFLIARHHQKSSPAGSVASSEYDTHSIGRSRLTRHDGVAKAHNHHHLHHHQLQPASPGPDSAAALKLHPPPNSDGIPVSVMLNLTGPTDGQPQPMTLPYHSGTLKFERNVMSTSLHNGTLPKDYKVKMVYL